MKRKQPLLKKLQKQPPFNIIIFLALITLLVVGGYFIVRSRAAGPNEPKETELGVVSGNQRIITNDSTSSNNGGIIFGASQSTNRNRLGVDLNYLPPGITRAQAYDKVAQLGFGWVRTGPAFDNYNNVTIFDGDLAQAKRTNVKVLAALTYAYGNIGTRADGHGRPKDPAAWARYAGQLVAHWQQAYPGVVGAVEVWNEANSAQFWNPVDPDAYADLLKRTYLEIKAVAPNMTIVSTGLATGGGNLAADATNDPTNPATFMKRLYAAGAGNSFDAAGNHPYELAYNTPNVTSSGIRNAFWIRKEMDKNGQPNKQIWNTEAGLDSCWRYPSLTINKILYNESQRSNRIIADLDDLWYGIHDQITGQTIGRGTSSDIKAGPYFVFKLYKHERSAITDGSGIGLGMIYNTKAYMQQNVTDPNAEPICKNPPSDYYEPGMTWVLKDYAQKLQ